MAEKDRIILLTGTIYPNASFTKQIDIAARIEDYRKSLLFYAGWGRVIFLENSGTEHPLPEQISSISGVEFVRLPRSPHYAKGKGFQEFEMLDSYIAQLPNETIVYKVSGRYLIRNFQKFWTPDWSDPPLFDYWSKRRLLITSFFVCSAGFYRKWIMGSYLRMDDESGNWAERVLFAIFSQTGISYQIFPWEPDVSVVSGSTGKPIKVHGPAKLLLIAAVRQTLRLLGVQKVIW